MVKDLKLDITLNNSDYKRKIKELKNKNKEFEQQLSTISAKSSIAFAAMGGSVALGVREFAKFDKEFTNVVTLLNKSSFATGNFDDNVTNMRTSLKDLSIVSGQSLEILNKGLFDMISATGDADNALKNLTVATKLAKAGSTDTSVAVDGLTSVYNAFGKEAGTLEQISQKFFTAQVDGKTTVEELADSIGNVAPIASQMGISFEEVLASTSALTLGGVKTRIAMNGIRQALALMIKPTAEAQTEMAKLQKVDPTLGFSPEHVARAGGFIPFLNKVIAASGGSQESLTRMFGSVEALTAILPLTAKAGEKYNNTLTKLSDSTSLAITYNKAYERANESAGASLDKIGASLKSMVVNLMASFAPVLDSISESVQSFAQTLNEINPKFLEIGARIATFVISATGLVAILSILGLGFIKLKNIVSLVNTSFLGFIGTTLNIAKSLPLLTANLLKTNLGFKGLSLQAKLTKIAMLPLIGVLNLVKLAFKSLFSATGLGAFIVFFPEIKAGVTWLYNNFKPLKAIVDGVSNAFKSLLFNFRSFSNALKDGNSVLENEKSSLKDYQKALDNTSNRLIKLKKERDNLSKGRVDSDDQRRIKIIDSEIVKLEELKSKLNQQAQEEIQLEQTKSEQVAQIKQQSRERDKQAKQQYRAEDLERIALWREQDLEAQLEQDIMDQENLRNKILTDNEIREQFDEEKLNKIAERSNKIREAEIKHGKVMGKIEAINQNAQIQAFREGSNELIGLQNSKNSAIKNIGKAAAIAQVIIDTPAAAMGAYRAMASIPLIGPGLGIVAAAAATAYGAERIGQIRAANTGAIVTSGKKGIDTEPFLLSRGESVVPADITQDLINQQNNLRGFIDIAKNNKNGLNNQTTYQFGDINLSTTSDDNLDILTDDLIEQIQDKIKFGG